MWLGLQLQSQQISIGHSLTVEVEVCDFEVPFLEKHNATLKPDSIRAIVFRSGNPVAAFRVPWHGASNALLLGALTGGPIVLRPCFSLGG